MNMFLNKEKMTRKKNKILAIASEGGHWVQLMRLSPALQDGEVVYVTTNPGYEKQVNGSKFYHVVDANRWEKIKLIKMGIQVFHIINKERPSVIISTGAAPGLFAIFIGRVFSAKTLWLDSIANAERLSMSGRLARPFAHLLLTQWQHLADNKSIFYKGNVIT